MIRLKKLEKTFTEQSNRIVALDGVDLEVSKGSISGVIGASGAGKSTLIRCINLLEKPTSGQVLVDGIELTALNPAKLRLARQQIGMIFQHFNLLANRSVYKNIALPLEFLGSSQHEIKKGVEPLLDLVGISDKANYFPAQLSGGQKQRVAIARALAVQPKVLLCDEATSALDPQTTQSILELLKDINSRLKLTILLITHEMEVVKNLCDRVAVLDKGKIVEENTVEGFFINPKSKVGRAFVHKAVRDNLPEEIQNNLLVEPKVGAHPVVRLVFIGHKVTKPIISQLCRSFSVDMNILESHMDYVHGCSMGFMTFEMLGCQKNTQDALEFIKQQTYLKVEVAGYVSR